MSKKHSLTQDKKNENNDFHEAVISNESFGK